jgi:hypothetical protein
MQRQYISMNLRTRRIQEVTYKINQMINKNFEKIIRDEETNEEENETVNNQRYIKQV